SFTLARDGEALAALVERLRGLAPALVVLEATAATKLSSPAQSVRRACRWPLSTPARSAILPAPPANWRRPTASMPRLLLTLPTRYGLRHGPSPAATHRPSENWWRVAVSSST